MSTGEVASPRPLERAASSLVGAACWLLASACAGDRDALMDVPVDMNVGTSTIVIHRPLPVGTRLHTQGVYMVHNRTTAKASGFVVHEEVVNRQIAYDITKTLLEVDLSGSPKSVRYDVTSITSSDDEPPPSVLTGGKARSVRLKGPAGARSSTTGGQSFDLSLRGGERKLAMRRGTLNRLEGSTLTDALGPSYELQLEEELAHMFAPKTPKRVGDEWDIDLERAAGLLEQVCQLEDAQEVTGRATFVASEMVGSVAVHRIQAWIKGTGKLHTEITYKMHANNHKAELQYSGAFPVDLSLPPIQHDWVVKANGQIIVEINDNLGDVEFELLARHQSQVLDLRR